MIKTTHPAIVGVCAILTLLMLSGKPGAHERTANASGSTTDVMAASYRTERNGWIYVHLEGTPEEVGYLARLSARSRDQRGATSL